MTSSNKTTTLFTGVTFLASGLAYSYYVYHKLQLLYQGEVAKAVSAFRYSFAIPLLILLGAFYLLFRPASVKPAAMPQRTRIFYWILILISITIGFFLSTWLSGQTRIMGYTGE